MKFYGLGWAAMSFSLVALYLIGRRNRAGFLSFITANACWILIGWLTTSGAIMFGNMVFMILNLRGYWNWRKTGSTSPHANRRQSTVTDSGQRR